MEDMDGGGGRDKETVKVVVRCRPLFGKEVVEGRKSIVSIDNAAALISIKCPESEQLKSFTFDAVYDESTSQRQFYDESGYPLVESIFEGYNGTIFAYGQTGCGKTHTMQGKDSPPELRGVIPHSFDHIFDTIKADPSREYMVRASYLEIYNEDIRDLLGDDAKKKLDLKEAVDGSVYVKDLTEVVVSDVDAMNRVMNRGFKNRTVGATLMNEGSSRSHSIFTVVVETSEKIEGEEHFKAGKLNLVDLAGSERQSKTGATGNRLKEGCKINLSLSALGNVISALVDGKGKHIPYRDSKLTRLLQDSLGGNTKTLMVAAVSPADYNYDETLSTLRYANRAKNIKNKPVVNEDPKDAKLREYKEEIERLKKLLESQSRGSVMGSASGMSTPTRPLSSSSVDSTPRELNSRGESTDNASLAKEREEIAKYQQEAAAMLEQAKRMMDEARALQAQQQQQQPAEEGQQPMQDPATITASTTASELREASPRAAVNAVLPPAISTASEADTPSSGRPRCPSNLPPLSSPHPPSSEPPPRREALAPESSPSASSSSPPSATASSPPCQRAAISPEEAAAKAAEDAKIAKALWEAAQIDRQAKEMMAKAQTMMEAAEARAKEAKKVKVVKEVVVKEVIPDHHVREKEELREMNQSILVQRDRMGKELERTQEAMESYLREKEELRAKLKKIESHILGGSSSRQVGGDEVSPSASIDSEIALLKQQVEYRRTQLKLKEKAKREARHEAERKAMAIEKQQMEEELKTAQETAQAALAAAKRKEVKHRAKLESMRQEIADLNNEFERERENLLDTIREQTKESKLLKQLVEVFLPQNELVKVWERAVWSEEREEWALPKLKPRSDFQKIKLPALPLGNGGSVSEGIGSGGAEVVSDDENSGAGPANQPGGGGVSGRASMSGSRQQQRRNLIPRAPTSVHSSGSTSKPSSSNEGSVVTSRGLLDATAPRSTATGRTAMPPDNGRLPSALNPGRYESFTTARGVSPSGGSRPDRKKDKGNGISRETNRLAELEPSNAFGGLATGLFYDSHHEAGGDSEPLLFPVGGGSEYQPRDRLQSRQGSRQGSRQERTRSSNPASSSVNPDGFDEFEARTSPPAASRMSGSRTDSRHHRHHRERREAAPQDEDGEAYGTSSSLLPSVESSSPDGRSRSGKHEKKKKKERREKHEDAATSGDPDAVKERVGGGGGANGSSRRGLQRGSANDQDYLYEDW